MGAGYMYSNAEYMGGLGNRSDEVLLLPTDGYLMEGRQDDDLQEFPR